MSYRVGDTIDAYHLVKNRDTGDAITNLDATNFNPILVLNGSVASESIAVSHVTLGYYRFRLSPAYSGRYDLAVEVLDNFDGSPGGGFEARTFWVLDAGVSLPWVGYGRGIIPLELLKSWIPQTDGLDDVELQRCIDAGSAWIETKTGRLFVAVDIEETHDGRERHCGSLLTQFRPLLYPANPLTVTEDGVSLTVASGYSPTSNLIVYPRTGKISRQTGGWWSRAALSNIAVTYRCGWESIDLPAEVQQLAAEVAWAMHQEARIAGINEISGPETSVKIMRGVSGSARDTLDAYTDYRESTACDWRFA